MVNLVSVKSALIYELKQVYDAECRTLLFVTHLLQNSRSDKLKKVIKSYRRTADLNRAKLELIFYFFNRKVSCPENKTICSIIKECNSFNFSHPDHIHDMIIISRIEQVVYYKLSVYKRLLCYARKLGLSKASSILSEVIECEEDIYTDLVDTYEEIEMSESNHSLSKTKILH